MPQGLPLIACACVGDRVIPILGTDSRAAKRTVATSQMPGSLPLPLVFPKVMPQWVLAQLRCIILIPLEIGLIRAFVIARCEDYQPWMKIHGLSHFSLPRQEPISGAELGCLHREDMGWGKGLSVLS